MVFQQFGLLPWRSVADNVGLGLELRGMAPEERRRVVAEQLELVGLAQWADRSVGELSGGMQQRVGLARAFATNADILLMDEPFSALDPLIRDKLQDELLALQARVKKTILFVSHDLDEALRLGDRISIMRHGRIVQTGTTQDIVLRPADDYVAEFVRRMNPLKVLTGAMIMRVREEMDRAEGEIFLDAARRYRLRLDAGGAPAALSLDGAAHPLRAVDDDEACPEGERCVIVAPASITLQGAHPPAPANWPPGAAGGRRAGARRRGRNGDHRRPGGAQPRRRLRHEQTFTPPILAGTLALLRLPSWQRNPSTCRVIAARAASRPRTRSRASPARSRSASRRSSSTAA